MHLPYKEDDVGSSPTLPTNFKVDRSPLTRYNTHNATVAERPNASACKAEKPLVRIQPVAPELSITHAGVYQW